LVLFLWNMLGVVVDNFFLTGSWKDGIVAVDVVVVFEDGLPLAHGFMILVADPLFTNSEIPSNIVFMVVAHLTINFKIKNE
jgi:hypothetical protein